MFSLYYFKRKKKTDILCDAHLVSILTSKCTTDEFLTNGTTVMSIYQITKRTSECECVISHTKKRTENKLDVLGQPHVSLMPKRERKKARREKEIQSKKNSIWLGGEA